MFVADRPESHGTDQLQLPLPSSRGWLDAELGVDVWSYPVPSCLSIPSLLQYRGLGCVPARSQALFLLSFNGKSWANPVGQHRASVLVSLPLAVGSQPGWGDVEALLPPQNLEYCIMVVGVPNVGKSSLINSLRRQHLRTGRQSRCTDFHS